MMFSASCKTHVRTRRNRSKALTHLTRVCILGAKQTWKHIRIEKTQNARENTSEPHRISQQSHARLHYRGNSARKNTSKSYNRSKLRSQHHAKHTWKHVRIAQKHSLISHALAFSGQNTSENTPESLSQKNAKRTWKHVRILQYHSKISRAFALPGQFCT